jgi:hypothetical protein
MKKAAFVIAIRAIEEQIAKDSEKSALLNKLGEVDFKPGVIVTTPLIENILTALKVEFSDQDDWIRYYIYDLQFGKKADYMQINVNGKPYKLYGASHLYDLLVNEIKEDD